MGNVRRRAGTISSSASAARCSLRATWHLGHLETRERLVQETRGGGGAIGEGIGGGGADAPGVAGVATVAGAPGVGGAGVAAYPGRPWDRRRGSPRRAARRAWTRPRPWRRPRRGRSAAARGGSAAERGGARPCPGARPRRVPRTPRAPREASRRRPRTWRRRGIRRTAPRSPRARREAELPAPHARSAYPTSPRTGSSGGGGARAAAQWPPRRARRSGRPRWAPGKLTSQTVESLRLVRPPAARGSTIDVGLRAADTASPPVTRRGAAASLLGLGCPRRRIRRRARPRRLPPGARRAPLVQLRPSQILYTYGKVLPYFSGCGRTLAGTLDAIASGSMRPADLPAIAVVSGGGGGRRAAEREDETLVLGRRPRPPPGARARTTRAGAASAAGAGPPSAEAAAAAVRKKSPRRRPASTARTTAGCGSCASARRAGCSGRRARSGSGSRART